MAKKKQPAPAQAAPSAGPALQQAQALIDQALQERDFATRVQLAQQALALSPDCVDAYALLAAHASHRKLALTLLQQAVAAGERVLGPAFLQQAAGNAWLHLEARPYLRARQALAEALWTDCRRDDAITHLRELLRLNPGDNQGARYTLAAWLLHLDRNAAVGALLAQYPDEASAFWAYTHALVAFRLEGDTIASRRLLKAARKANKHVPPYLTGAEQPTGRVPLHYSPGQESEALVFLDQFLAPWTDTPGAVTWVRTQTRTKRPAPPAGVGPTPGSVRTLSGLPRGADTWQIDCRTLPLWMPNNGEPVRPWIVLVTSATDDIVLAHLIQDQRPADAVLWDTLAQAMQHPLAGTPHRPAEVQFPTGQPWESFAAPLAALQVQATPVPTLAQMDTVFAGMVGHLAGPIDPGLLDVEGITPEMAAAFYDAAAAFFRARPWKQLGYEAAIRIECDRHPQGPWYGVIMGQVGVSRGLALYHDFSILQQMWGGPVDADTTGIQVVTAVSFGEPWTIPVRDLDALGAHGWPVAGDDAYPDASHTEGLDYHRRAEPWELNLLEACLRGIPDFLTRRRQDDGTPETLAVATAEGPVRLVLAWVQPE